MDANYLRGRRPRPTAGASHGCLSEGPVAEWGPRCECEGGQSEGQPSPALGCGCLTNLPVGLTPGGRRRLGVHCRGSAWLAMQGAVSPRSTRAGLVSSQQGAQRGRHVLCQTEPHAQRRFPCRVSDHSRLALPGNLVHPESPGPFHEASESLPAPTPLRLHQVGSVPLRSPENRGGYAVPWA